MGGRREIVCSGCISETVRCRKFILGRDIGWGGWGWGVGGGGWVGVGVQRHGLTFDLAVVTFSLKILSGLYISATIRCRKLILGRDIS